MDDQFVEKITQFWNFMDMSESYIEQLDKIEQTHNQEVNKKQYDKNIIEFFNGKGNVLFYKDDKKCILDTDIPSSFYINLQMVGNIEYKFPYKNHKIYHLLSYSHDYDKKIGDYQDTHYKKYTIDKILEPVPLVKMLINPERIESRLLATRRLLQDLCKISDTDIHEINNEINIKDNDTNSYPKDIKMALAKAPNNKSSICSKITIENKDKTIDSKHLSKGLSNYNNSFQISDGKIKGKIQLASNIPESLKVKAPKTRKQRFLNFVKGVKNETNKKSTIKVKVGHRN